MHIPLLNPYCSYVSEFLNLPNRGPKGDLISSLFITDNCIYTVKLLRSHIETEWTHYKPGTKKLTTDMVSDLIPLPLTLQTKL